MFKKPPTSILNEASSNLNFEYKLKNLESQFRLMILSVTALVLIGTLNLTYLYYTSKTNTAAAEPRTTLSTAVNKPVVNKPYQININTFYENAAISEVAYQLELKKRSISTAGTTNCATSEIPPIVNGCNFTIRPFASQVSLNGSYLLNLIFQAKINPEDRIAVDIKDTEKNELSGNLGVITGKDSQFSITLPSQLKASEQIFVRLWPKKDSAITISEIAIEYLQYSFLQPVKLKLPDDILVNNQGKKLSIYLDLNKSGKYNKDTSILWNCNHDFPGVKPIILDSQKIYSLLREDSCIQNNYPPEWKKDNFENSLSGYNYLAILNPDTPKQQVFSFEVIPNQAEYQL